MKKSVKIGIIILIVLISGAAMYYYNNLPLEVEVEVVNKTNLISDFKESGKIVPEDSYSVAAPYDGRVKMVVRSGEKVERGQLIAVLDDRDLRYSIRQIDGQLSSLSGQRAMSSPQIYESQVEALEIGIEMARINIERLEEDFQRYTALYESGAIPRVELQGIEKALEDANKGLLLREKELELIYETSRERAGTASFYSGQRQALMAQRDSINDKISRSSVYAPASGIVTQVYVSEGGFASSMVPILDISATERVVARADILVRDAAALSVGDSVKVVQKVRNDEIIHEGRISRISSYAKTSISPLGLSEQRVEVDVKFEGAENLFIGYDIDIVIETLRLENIIVLSKLSVFREDGRYFVWKIDGDIIRKQEVKIGYESDFEMQIISGLEDGDIIIMDPNNTSIEEGKKVSYEL